MKIIELEEVDSTNNFCKRYQGVEDITVIAARQSGGRGTKGRGFSSEEGGLYVSVMKNHKNFPAENAFKIMLNACVAVCKTLEGFGVNPVIRWANDVLVNGKKICGTLIENTFSGAYITRSIVGTGINVNNEIPAELCEIATSLSAELNKNIKVSAVKKPLLKNLEKDYSVADYKKFINWLGKEVTLKTNEQSITATAIDIAEDGRLIVKIDGETKKISSAEVSLRL
ncbi:MAG: biotin--[acetyl-CoA-carboxylase] ligase [Clostridia bacterium]|nr:biotin--[acetyl-CoA-carboxylase] ligase [Clostridia bacterium]